MLCEISETSKSILLSKASTQKKAQAKKIIEKRFYFDKEVKQTVNY